MCRLVILLLIDCLVSQALLMFNKVISENACLMAMCETDSGCVPKGCSLDQNDRIGCGYFRLNIYQFRQCFQPGRRDGESEEEAWIHCSEDYECSAQCIKSISARYRTKCYGKSDCQAMSRIHDGGSNGCRERNTIVYWKRVREKCGHKCEGSFFSRHRHRR